MNWAKVAGIVAGAGVVTGALDERARLRKIAEERAQKGQDFQYDLALKDVDAQRRATEQAADPGYQRNMLALKQEQAAGTPGTPEYEVAQAGRTRTISEAQTAKQRADYGAAHPQEAHGDRPLQTVDPNIATQRALNLQQDLAQQEKDAKELASIEAQWGSFADNWNTIQQQAGGPDKVPPEAVIELADRASAGLPKILKDARYLQWKAIRLGPALRANAAGSATGEPTYEQNLAEVKRLSALGGASPDLSGGPPPGQPPAPKVPSLGAETPTRAAEDTTGLSQDEIAYIRQEAAAARIPFNSARANLEAQVK